MKNFIPKQKNLLKLFTLALVFIFSFQQLAFAGRSSAGGGKIAKFDVGKWALGTAVGMGSMAIGTSIAGGISGIAGGEGFASGFGNSISGLSSLSGWANNFNLGVATGQVSRAVGAMGQYYEWNPKTTLLVRSIASGMASGGINPGSFGADSTLSGIALGGINGAVEGGILYGLSNKKGEYEPWAGALAGLAGGMVTGMISYGPSGYFGEHFVPDLAKEALSVGVGYAVQSADPEDRYIVSQALSGLSPIVSTLASPALYQTSSEKEGWKALTNGDVEELLKASNAIDGIPRGTGDTGGGNVGGVIFNKPNIYIPAQSLSESGGVDMSMPVTGASFQNDLTVSQE